MWSDTTRDSAVTRFNALSKGKPLDDAVIEPFMKFGHKAITRQCEATARLLEPGEEVVRLTWGLLRSNGASIALTRSRIIVMLGTTFSVNCLVNARYIAIELAEAGQRDRLTIKAAARAPVHLRMVNEAEVIADEIVSRRQAPVRARPRPGPGNARVM